MVIAAPVADRPEPAHVELQGALVGLRAEQQLYRLPALEPVDSLHRRAGVVPDLARDAARTIREL